MPARINKKAAEAVIRKIRTQAMRAQAILMSEPTEPAQIEVKKGIIATFGISFNYFCDELDDILNLNTKDETPGDAKI